jgi:hypothetical protein
MFAESDTVPVPPDEVREAETLTVPTSLAVIIPVVSIVPGPVVAQVGDALEPLLVAVKVEDPHWVHPNGE